MNHPEPQLDVHTNRINGFRYDRILSRTDDPERKEQFEKNFAPLYFIRSYPQDKSKREMSVDPTRYQPQFERNFFFAILSTFVIIWARGWVEIHLTNAVPAGNYEVCTHVFQIIFLNNGPEEENIGPRTRLMTKRFDGCPLAITGRSWEKGGSSKTIAGSTMLEFMHRFNQWEGNTV